MANLTSDQATQLSDNFYSLAMAIGDFRYENWDKLSFEENKELSETQNMLLQTGEDILAFSTTLIMDETIDSLAKINSITGEIQDSIKKLNSIQKGLNVAAAILLLGVAIVNRDTKGIGDSIKGVYETWQAPIL
ncbi:hypothetical protein [Algoriphagus yeomjeoni]|uniref:Uncharacterized protein n=1 Tax=Algoriphagus yeomjeoni TaxID=291403 RepID=A0A327PNH4_9BACT|nr:hypothetical protein [Algoriphagus yeomjeoni]RAI93865.1 hypothetical protein LV83_00771 [Algoriphagus yeomjeoni]